MRRIHPYQPRAEVLVTCHFGRAALRGQALADQAVVGIMLVTGMGTVGFTHLHHAVRFIIRVHGGTRIGAVGTHDAVEIVDLQADAAVVALWYHHACHRVAARRDGILIPGECAVQPADAVDRHLVSQPVVDAQVERAVFAGHLHDIAGLRRHFHPQQVVGAGPGAIDVRQHALVAVLQETGALHPPAMAVAGFGDPDRDGPAAGLPVLEAHLVAFAGFHAGPADGGGMTGAGVGIVVMTHQYLGFRARVLRLL